jgi:ceramide glucosyltransferase
MIWLVWLATALTAAGLLQAVAGYLALRRFTAAPPPPAGPRPGITVLKPLHGDEPLLEAALASFCTQRYPQFQLVCGVRDSADPAIAVVERLRARFPACDMALVVNGTLHGENRKIGNLINMLPAAKHDLLLIGDSDVHAPPDTLARVADTLALPGTGLATTLYTGLPANGSLAAGLGATAITHSLLPGVLLARALGRQDCLGAAMGLRRQTLAAIGGLEALVHHLADDNVLGRLVGELGQRIRLAPTICATTVPEAELAALYRHELRWARTIQALVPGAFVASAVQYPLAWAALAVVLAGGDVRVLAGYGLAWACRAAIARGVDRLLRQEGSGLGATAPVWLFPLRDLMSIAVMAASYGGDRVEWRGEILHTALDKPEHQTHIQRMTSDSAAAD